MIVCDLNQKHCKPCEGGVLPYTAAQIQEQLSRFTGWEVNVDGTEIKKTFKFRDYYRTMAFVNAVAFIAHTENHHPDLSVFYDRCVVAYQTHAIAGLSENDFICAAKVDALI